MSKHLRAAILSGICAAALAGCNWFVSAEEHIQRAESFIAAGDERAAAIELQSALSSKPDNVRARLLLARVSLRMGDVQAAEKEVQRAIESHAAAGEIAPIAAEIKLARGDYAALLSNLDSGKSGLNDTDAANYRGMALMATGNLEGARAAFEAALVASPGSAFAKIGLAETRVRGGDFDGALATLEEILTVTPGDARASSLKGRILGQRGEFKEATAALLNAQKSAGGQLSTFEYNALLSALVESYIASGDLKSSHQALDELARRVPDAPLVHLQAARIAMAEQNYPLAVNEAQKVIAAAPKHPMAKMVLGAALLANGNYNQAEAQLSELVSQSPENLEARKLLADTNLRLRRPDVAMQVLAPTQQSASADPQVEALLAWANLQRGDEAEAIELLKHSIESQPENPELKLDLALAYLTAGRHQEAIELLNSLPTSAGSARREQLLIAAISAGNSSQSAQVEVEKIVKAHAGDVGVLSVAASFYAQNRNFVRARELQRAAIALDPKNTGSLARLARLEGEAGDDAAARAAWQSVLAVDPKNQNALVSMAQISLRNNDAREAVIKLEAARQADEKAIEARLLLAAEYLRERKTSQADDVLRELAELADTNPALSVVIGRLYSEAGRYDEALNQFRAAARRDPRNPARLLEVARVLLARGDQAGARDAVQKALDLDPQAIAANGLMVGIDLKAGNHSQALTRAAEMRRQHPDDAAAAMLDGDAKFALRDAAGAAKSFADAYRLSPSSAAAIRAYQARTLARLPAPMAQLTDWLQRQPKDLAARMIYAQALLERGQNAGAIAEYERVVASPRPGAMALNNLAWLYQQSHDPRAEATAKRAFELAPDVGAIADTYGWILVEAGRPAEALPILERAANVQGAPPEIRYHYAVALAKGGKPGEARAVLRPLRDGPAFDQSARVLALLNELGDGP